MLTSNRDVRRLPLAPPRCLSLANLWQRDGYVPRRPNPVKSPVITPPNHIFQFCNDDFSTFVPNYPVQLPIEHKHRLLIFFKEYSPLALKVW